MKTVELFAGAGGLGIGVSSSGFKPVIVIERDPHCCNTIRENAAVGLQPFAGWPLIQCDVHNFDFTIYEDRVDLVSGGPPCQPFSLGGKHGAYRDKRDLFP